MIRIQYKLYSIYSKIPVYEICQSIEYFEIQDDNFFFKLSNVNVTSIRNGIPNYFETNEIYKISCNEFFKISKNKS